MKKCINCDKIYSDQTLFCSNCGKELVDNTVSTPVQQPVNTTNTFGVVNNVVTQDNTVSTPVQQPVNPTNTFGFANNVVTQDNTVSTPVQQPVNPVNTFGVANNGTQSNTVTEQNSQTISTGKFGFTNNVVTQDNALSTPVQQPVNPVNTFGVANNGTQSNTVSTPVQQPVNPVNTFGVANNGTQSNTVSTPVQQQVNPVNTFGVANNVVTQDNTVSTPVQPQPVNPVNTFGVANNGTQSNTVSTPVQQPVNPANTFGFTNNVVTQDNTVSTPVQPQQVNPVNTFGFTNNVVTQDNTVSTPVQPQQVNPVNTFGFTNNVVTQDNTVITPVQQPVNPVNTFGVTNNGTQSSTVSTPVQPQPVNTYQNKNNYQSNKKTNNKKPMLLLVIILIAVGIFYYFPSLSGDNSRTIMIYMTGSDLESKSSLATVDLDSIDYDLMDSENINVVVIIGGSESWHNDYTSTDQTSIYELTNDGFVEVKTQELQNMGDDEVLSDFLTYTYDAYKADEYSLIFWNHGAAILGSQSDEIYDDFLDLTEMEQALANSPFNSNNKLENIIFRTCLNGTIEVASVFNDYAQYLVASEEITYGTSYTSVLDFINEIQTSDTAEDVGIKYINSYKEQIEFIEDSYNTEIVSTYSIIDLSKVEETIDAFGEFVNDIDIESNYYQIAKVRSSLFQFAYTTGGDSSYDMVDMYTLVEELSSLSNDKATKVLNLLDEMIVYNWNENVDATGVSIYFPYNASTYIKTYLLSIYSDFTALDDYYSFITEFNTIKTNSFYQYDFSNNVSDTVEADENYDFNLTLTEEQVEYYASSEFFVFRDNGDGTYLPVYLGQQVTLEDNILSSNINDRQLKIVSTDGTQNILTLFENYETTTNLNYNVYISLFNYDTTPMLATSASATIAYNKETSEINLGSIIESNSDEYAASNILLDINDYTSIIFASSSYEIIDENGELRKDWYDYSNGTIEGVSVAPNEFSFELETFDDEYDYYCTFRIYDVYGNHEYSNLIKLEK